MKKFLTKHRLKLIILLALALILFTYFYTKSSATKQGQNYYLAEEVKKGDVYSGIITSGEIVAAQKLNLDIYKKKNRIDGVNIVNGKHVNKGDLLFSFDSSDINLGINRSNIDARQAELDISEQLNKNSSVDTQELVLVQKILNLEQSLSELKRNYYSADLVFEPEYMEDVAKEKPQISGEYTQDEEGRYFVELYSSSSESGLSFRYSGLESGRGSVYFNEPLRFGERGLFINFPENIDRNTSWVLDIPNIGSQKNTSLRESYEINVADVKNQIDIAKDNLDELRRTGDINYKNIDLQKAKLSLGEAKQDLKEHYEMLDERIIKAPFSGTIESVENVVVGATPTGGAEDPVQFGVLISDEFYAEFNLSIDELSIVELGQKILLGISTKSGKTELEASLVEISSLPVEGASPQYKAKAAIKNSDAYVLREGILVDVHIVSDSRSDVLVVPNAALEFSGKKASLLVSPGLSSEQERSVQEQGVFLQDTQILESYRVEVEIGLVGSYYTEITSGVNEGEYIVISSSANLKESILEMSSGLRSGGRGGANRSDK